MVTLMASIGDRFNRALGKTRFVVSRLFLHLRGDDVTPVLGVLNAAARKAVDSEGDMQTLGEALVDICTRLLELEIYWLSAANEGDVFYNEGEAGDYVTELFTDSAQRYLSEPLLEDTRKVDPLTLPTTENVIVMMTVAFEGEIPELETDLSQIEPLRMALKALINLHYQNRLRAVQVHFSPARMGDRLFEEDLVQYYPELLPL